AGKVRLRTRRGGGQEQLPARVVELIIAVTLWFKPGSHLSSMENGVQERQPLLSRESIEATPVYPIIHMIRQDIIALTAPDLTYTLIHPLLEKYCNIQRAHNNLSVVFCLLLNRIHFIRDDNIVTSAVSASRATLCEILAIRVLRDFAENMMDLALILTTSWPVYSGASHEALEHGREEFVDFDPEERVGNAIEMAIVGKAKRFIKSTSCQKVIDAIWSLKVPAIRSVLEYINFLILFVLFIIAIEQNDPERINLAEADFAGRMGSTRLLVSFSIHCQARQYRARLTVATYCCYAFLSVYGVYYDRQHPLSCFDVAVYRLPDPAARSTGVDCLALIACMMFPRLAFVTLKNNLMVLSLRAMIMQFAILMMIAAFCFCGFLYALWTLSRNQAESHPPSTIAWWMLDLWFGLDASGFDESTHFHPIFGPILMVTYACLSNTLLLTGPSTFWNCAEPSRSCRIRSPQSMKMQLQSQAMFRKAVSTIEGVKADSLFSYQPPINLIALCVMLPASYVLSPRWFHKVNVFMIRHADELPRTAYDRIPFSKDLLVQTATLISRVFEIEDDLLESALARGEVPVTAHHVSKPPPSPPHRPPTTTPPNGVSPPGQRNRVASLLHRGTEAAQSFTSPLAQIFQPLVIDDGGIPEDEAISLGPPVTQSQAQSHSYPNTLAPPPAGVSYGPAYRRRLSSMHVRDASGRAQLQAHARRSSETPRMMFPLSDDPFSTSPDEHSLSASPDHRTPSTGSLPTAEDVEENKDMPIMRRLNEMDARQKRIEEMLQILVRK
ncbi:unnamed protein product, partial [Mycena citricolor]